MNKNTKVKITILGISILSLGATIIAKKLLPKVPLRKYTKNCLYIAIMDDEIARNNFEGKKIEKGDTIIFPDRRETLMYRYRLHLELYKKYTEEELEKEIKLYERLLVESREPKEETDNIQIEIGRW